MSTCVMKARNWIICEVVVSFFTAVFLYPKLAEK
jgi:hypothetical protein